MTLPVGQISLSQVNVELQQGATTTISLNQSNVRSLAGVPSGQISMQNLQGKSFYFFFTPTISSNTAGYDLRSQAVAAGWDQVIPLSATVTINSGVYVYAPNTSSYAFTVSGSFPSGSILTVVNNGFIVGYGGGGGPGGPGGPSGFVPGTPGGSGGPALFAGVATVVTNNGTIGGGGGGGGGGGASSRRNNPKQQVASSYPGGSGGGGTAFGAGGGAPIPGGSASLTTAGTGGAGGLGNNGGSGGTYGNSGSAGTPGGRSGAGAGGSAGNAVVGNSNITWPSFGTRLGGIT